MFRERRPAYPDYNDGLHCSEVEPVKGIPIKRGWDFGLTPACVFTQVTPEGRWIVFDELCGEYIGFETFTECVLEMSSERYAGFTFEDYGDPAGQASSSMTHDKAEKTCFDMPRGRGIGIQAGEQNPTIRIECVRKPLNALRGGKPQFQISPRCEVLRKGFRGRYQYKRIKITGSGERYHDAPDKNEFSHPHNALQYVATKVFGDAVRGREETRQRWKKPMEELYREAAKRRASIV